MVIGILQIELHIGDAASLKDKRRVVSSLKDRLHREHLVAVAETDQLDKHQTAVMGIVAVANQAPRVQGTLSRIVDQLKINRQFVLSDHAIEILSGY